MKAERRSSGRIALLWAALALAGMTTLATRGSSRESARAAGGSEGDRDGEALYAKNCLSCHGDSGGGDGPSDLFLKKKPADLRSEAIRGMSDDDLFSRITEGKPPMPGFGRRLSPDERRALVRYLRALPKSGP